MIQSNQQRRRAMLSVEVAFVLLCLVTVAGYYVQQRYGPLFGHHVQSSSPPPIVAQ